MAPLFLRARWTDANFQDTAPDIYETPELTDDTSTVPVSGRPDVLAVVPPAVY